MPSARRRSPVDRLREPFDRRPLAREGLIAVLAFGAFLLWKEVLRGAGGAIGSVGVGGVVDSSAASLLVTGLVSGGVVAAGTVAFAVAYARLRGLSVPTTAPGTDDFTAVAATVSLPAGAVAAVSVVASASGTSLAALEGTYVAADGSLVVLAAITALGLFIGLPAYVLLAHAVVQRTLRRGTDPPVAIGLTTLLFGLTGPTDLAGPGLPLRAVAATLLLAVAVALPVYADHFSDVELLPRLCAVPLALFAGGFVADWLTGIDGVAAGAFALSPALRGRTAPGTSRRGGRRGRCRTAARRRTAP